MALTIWAVFALLERATERDSAHGRLLQNGREE